jgi:hypothetical protein
MSLENMFYDFFKIKYPTQANPVNWKVDYCLGIRRGENGK